MRKPVALALLLATALSGCNLAPKHIRPPMPVAPTYRAEFQPEAGTRAAPTIPWREFFTDPRLQTIITLALDNNRDLRVAVARIAEARGQYRIQNAERFPLPDVTASATRNHIGAGALGAQAGGFGAAPGTTAPSGFTYNRFAVNVGISAFELDFWGRVANLSEAARANYLSTISAERAFRLSLIRDVAIQYLLAREYIERISIAEATVTSRREGLRIAKLRLDSGVTSALDYRQAETLLTQAETALASLKLGLARTRDAVEVLIGGPIPASLPEAFATADQPITRDIAPGLPSALLENRPDLIAAEEQLRAARANIGAARAAFFPQITLTGSAGLASNALGDLFKSGAFVWNAGPSVTLPIFNLPQARGNLTVARAQGDIALANYERAIQVAFQEVSDGLAGRRYLAEQVAAQERATAAQRRLAALARSRYRTGVANYIEVLDAERNLFDAEQALITVRRSELESLVALYVALGGGLAGEPAAPR